MLNGEYIPGDTVTADMQMIKNLKGIETFEDWLFHYNLVGIGLQEFYIN